MNIIQSRLERALTVALVCTPTRQRGHGQARRGSYQKGVRLFPHCVNVPLPADLKRKVDDFAACLNVAKAVLIRDAIAFYIGVAEQEFGANPIVPTKVKIRRPKKRRAPGRRVHLIADKSEEPFVNMFCREAGVLIDSDTFQSQNVVPASPTSRLKCTQDETAATCERCLSGLKRAKAAH